MYRHAPQHYDCPFCAVVRGEERPPWTFRDDVVWRDDLSTAWVNRRWWTNNPGNVVLVPNRHVENIYELDRELAAARRPQSRAVGFEPCRTSAT